MSEPSEPSAPANPMRRRSARRSRGDAPAAARPHADGPTAERMRDASVSAPDASVAEVLEAEPPVVAIVRPADADGAEARLFRAIGEFAGEHRAEIEALATRSSAAPRRRVPFTTSPLGRRTTATVRPSGRAIRRASGRGGREGEGEDTARGSPGRPAPRVDVSGGRGVGRAVRADRRRVRCRRRERCRNASRRGRGRGRGRRAERRSPRSVGHRSLTGKTGRGDATERG